MIIIRKSVLIWAITMITLAISQLCAAAADKGAFSTAPVKNSGKKWRIGYYEGGEYKDYQLTLIATIEGLMDLGWLEKSAIPPQNGIQTKALWNWLAKDAKSEYLEFVADAHYSANWDDKIRGKMASDIIQRLSQAKDLDLMIAMGTWAGKDIANSQHQTPTLVLSTSDPIAAGIIKSAEDSGCDNVHARVDPLRHERQMRIFHDVIGFKKLGVFYEDTEAGRCYAALDKVQKVAAERGFELIVCHTIDDVPDIKRAEESVIKCAEELSAKVDAIYVTQQNGVNAENLPKLVAVANKHHIPTFAQAGSEEVKEGILLSLSQAGFKADGRFHAENIAKVFNGAKPRDLDQVFESPPKIAINLATASIIGFDPPVDVLGAADEIYQEIESSPQKSQ